MSNEDEKALRDTQIVDMSDSIDSDAVSAMLGRTVAGKYKISRRLARGGMGVVYLAEHVTLGREVVFKILSYHLADDSRAHSRFEREARGLSVLDHPNVVTVHDFGVEKGLTYIVMEYVDGENLSQLRRRQGRIPYDKLLPIAMQTIDAIAAAHDKTIVHRDIKPSNVMVTNRAGREDFVKVLDFGLAKLATSSVDITQGNLVGTVSYLAPEVIRGAEASPASDVYSLGVMLYYLLCGEKPFTGSDDMSVLYQHVNEEPQWLGDLIPVGEAPEEFLDFVHRCMIKDPKDRPQTAGELRRILGDLVSLPSISAFSLDSATALPRYRPADSEASASPSRQTSPSGVGIRRDSEFSVDERRQSDMSISMQRPNSGVRVGVIAFVVLSVGLAIVAIVVKSTSKTPEPAPPPAVVAPTPTPEPAKPMATEGTLVLHTTPSGTVAVDGELRGETPIELVLAPGRHVVTISKSGYSAWTQSVDVTAGERRRVDVFLTKRGSDAEPKVTVSEPEPAVVPPQPIVAEPIGRPIPPPDPAPTNSAPDEQPAETTGTAAAEPPAAEPPPEPKPRKGGLLSVDDNKQGLLPVE